MLPDPMPRALDRKIKPEVRTSAALSLMARPGDGSIKGRKVAILILEFFDRHGITVRRGDLRRTVPQKLEQFGPRPAA